jgi:hypothetical protein
MARRKSKNSLARADSNYLPSQASKRRRAGARWRETRGIRGSFWFMDPHASSLSGSGEAERTGVRERSSRFLWRGSPLPVPLRGWLKSGKPSLPIGRSPIPHWTDFHSQSDVAGLPIGRYSITMSVYPRLAEKRVRAALRDTRIVVLNGPRQSGKTTLARRFAKAGRVYLTLDDRATLAAAKSDPVAFVRDLDRAVIDEVQRAPEILLAIKRSVDEDKRAGRFLLTGSANLLTLAAVRESLAGSSRNHSAVSIRAK